MDDYTSFSSRLSPITTSVLLSWILRHIAEDEYKVIPAVGRNNTQDQEAALVHTENGTGDSGATTDKARPVRLADADAIRCWRKCGRSPWKALDSMGRMSNGLPAGIHRRRWVMLGNCVVPQQAELAFTLIWNGW